MNLELHGLHEVFHDELNEFVQINGQLRKLFIFDNGLFPWKMTLNIK